MTGLYTKRHLLEALRLASLQHPDLRIGHTAPTLLKYEKMGIIPPSSHPMTITGGMTWRFYSGEEIVNIVNNVIAYRKEVQKNNALQKGN